MPFDPTNSKDLSRLVRAISSDRQKLRRYVENYKLIMGEVHGDIHGEEKPSLNRRRPINNLAEMFDVLTPALVGANPTCRVSNPKRPRMASMLQEKLRRRIVENNLYLTLQDCVQDALVRIGIIRVGIEVDTEQIEVEGTWHDLGKPYADAIALPDFVMDMREGREDQMDYMGHRYCRRLDYLKDNPKYNQEVVETLTPAKFNAKGGSTSYGEGLYDEIDLLDVYLPESRAIVTLVDQDWPDARALRVIPYDGMEGGPYLFLKFNRNRGKKIPTGPAPHLFDLHDFNNRSLRRVFRQADRQAEYWTYTGEGEVDAESHRKAYDGQFIRVDSHQSVQRNTKGGVNPHTLGTSIHGRNLFNERAGNLRALAGTGASSGTVGQDHQILAQSSKEVARMRGAVDDFAREVLIRWAWYEWTDPVRQERISRMTSTGQSVDSLWTPEEREGDVVQYEIQIVPGSMEYRSNEMQVASIMESVQAITQTMQLPSSQPIVFNHMEFVGILKELRNQPELSSLLGVVPDKNSVVAGVRTNTASGGGAQSAASSPADDNAQVQQLLNADVGQFDGGSG